MVTPFFVPVLRTSNSFFNSPTRHVIQLTPTCFFKATPPSFSFPTTRRSDQRRAVWSCQSSSSDKQGLYNILGISSSPDPRTLSTSEIRSAYIKLAKEQHPDLQSEGAKVDISQDFDKITYAWSILSDEHLRSVYDTSGEEGLKAVQSIEQRKQDIDKNLSNMSGDQLDMLSETGQLFNGSLLSPSAPTAKSLLNNGDFMGEVEREENEDACPRSIEEAVFNIESHGDESVRYYTLWWVYRFKVKEAEAPIINLLRNPQSALRLKRRSALALGVMAQTTMSIEALIEAFKQSDDYFLRYRCAEALTNTAYRMQHDANLGISFDTTSVFDDLLDVLKKGGKGIKCRLENKNGFSNQESLFDIDAIEDEATRQRLKEIFQRRQQQEQMNKRTTMTPQLGVEKVGSAHSEDDQPYEWIIKAVCAILQVSHPAFQNRNIADTVDPFTQHELPLVRYAAHKALFCLLIDESHAETIVKALDYGIEHHYSQRVLCRDLGDMGYWKGAKAITECPMVENSFKILALKNMLGKLEYDAMRDEVKQVLAHMDSLL